MTQLRMPEGLTLARTTDELDAESVPAGLLRAHRLANDVWGLLRVRAGTMRLVWEDGDEPPVELTAGDAATIPPETRHHVELGPGARFVVEFHR